MAFSLCMLSSVNGNRQVSNGLHGQREMAFVEKYRTEIQAYIMIGDEIGWQHCDILSANNYRDDGIPQIIMDLDQVMKLNTKITFSKSHCLLVTYHVNREDDLYTLMEFGRKTFLTKRLALVITVDSGLNLEIATNSTNLPFLVAVQLHSGQEMFICPIVGGEDHSHLDPFMCKQSYTSYKDKSLKIGVLGIEPYLVPTKSGIDGTDVRLIGMLSDRLQFNHQIVIPSSFLDATKLVDNEGMFSIF